VAAAGAGGISPDADQRAARAVELRTINS
jgi:hypothetical protein